MSAQNSGDCEWVGGAERPATEGMLAESVTILVEILYTTYIYHISKIYLVQMLCASYK